MKPKHQKAPAFIVQGLFKNIASFKELEQRIANLPVNERGDAFEVFAEAYFATQRLSQAAEVWPGKSIPISLRESLGLTSRDMGVDGILRTKEEHYHAYQVKFRSDRASLTWEELSTFMGLSDRVEERVLFTNSIDLPELMQDRTGFYAIKGNDLDSLDESDFQCIEEWLKSGAIEFKRKNPWPHQKEALTNILSALNVKDRTTAVMACGTGKTLISLWAAEQMDAAVILILLPSLSLVRQMLLAWMKETAWNDHSYLCVCSDQSIVKGIDKIVLHQSDLNFPVTTDSESVKRFLIGKNKRKLIFSTYHSSKVVAEGLPQGFSFDLGIFDEAHKTAGREGTSFSFALKNENIPIKKRLFLTATPRHYDVNKRDNDGDPQLVFSMDDQETYGSISHKLSFASAAAMGIICKYKIVISVVTDEMIDREVLKRGEVIFRGDVVNANQIARALAMKNAIEEYGVKRIFTFHSSVKAAKSFTERSGEGVSTHLENFDTFHVNGEMPTSRRESMMREFEKAPQAVMSNARCLTEGVDVPAVDMVAFMSPKKSRVDIVQAVGRAMRKAPFKEYGYIFLPIFLESAKGESIEAALENTQFQDVWDVLEAMKEQDESLAEIIQQMRENHGKQKGFNESKLREHLEIIGPELCIHDLQSAITSALVNKLSSAWDERYGQLVCFKEMYGHCKVPDDYVDDKALGAWVGKQRSNFKQNKLSEERVRKLNEIDFVWDPISDAWEEMFSALLKFKERSGHCKVPTVYEENKSLYAWIGTQRLNYSREKLSKEYIIQLEEIGFAWDPKHEDWERMFDVLCEFQEKYGHCNVPRDNANKALSNWVTHQRVNYRKRKVLSEEQISRLETIGFIWDPLEAAWNEMFNALCEFKRKNEHCYVPRNTENRNLVAWMVKQRSTFKLKKLSDKRINALNEIDFVWDPKYENWEKMFLDLRKFKEIKGHCIVPRGKENKLLARWVTHQREKYKQGSVLSEEQISRLETIGFIWDPLEATWNEMFNALCEFKRKNEHCYVPRNTENRNLVAWMVKQRSTFKLKKLSDKRIIALNEIDFVWDPKYENWEKMFLDLRKFKEIKGHCIVPRGKENKLLARWVTHQREKYKQGSVLSEEQISRLETIGFIWDPLEAT